MRLWSSESYKCLREYSLGDEIPLVDFDFDESKVGFYYADVLSSPKSEHVVTFQILKYQKMLLNLDYMICSFFFNFNNKQVCLLLGIFAFMQVVGLVGTRICIWRRHGSRSIFPTRAGTFTKGLCMRYVPQLFLLASMYSPST